MYFAVFRSGGINYGNNRGAAEAIKKWQEKTDEIRFRVPKGDKERLTAHAAQFGESLTAFLNRAAAEAVERDNQK